MRAGWLMPVQYAGPRTRRMATDAPVFFRSKRAEVICGCVQITAPMPNVDGLAQAETRQAFQERHLLALRMALIGTARHLRKQHKAVLTCDAQLRAVTHEILAMGAP